MKIEKCTHNVMRGYYCPGCAEAWDSREEHQSKISSLQSEIDTLKKENLKLLNQKEDNWQLYVDANNQTLLKEKRIRGYVEEIERLKASAFKWINVVEDLPKKPSWYLAVYKAIDEYSISHVARSFFDNDFSNDEDRFVVTHWAELPEMPEFLKDFQEEKKEDTLNKEERVRKPFCSHENTQHRNLRCDVCCDCGYVVEIDV
jgi:hypothetical protein